MANDITEVLPKLLAQGLLALRQNAIMPRLVNRSYENLASQKGNVINVPIPSAISARDVTPALTQATSDSIVPTAAQVTLDFWKTADFNMTDSDMQSVMDGTIPMQASEAIKALGNAIDAYILGKHVGIYGNVGAAGTTPFASAITVAGQARTLLNRQLAPMDNRVAVLDPNAEGNLLTLSNVLQFDQRGDQGGIIEGTIGRKLGMSWFMDQNVPSYTPGTGWATGYTFATAGAASGAVSVTLVNASAAGTVKVGDIFAYNGQSHVITAAATASAAVALTVTFKPALNAAAASGAAVTVIGTAYAANLAFHRDAFAWASRPLADIQGLGNQIVSAVDDVSGVALRLEVSRQYKMTTFAWDVLGGANLIRPELAVKILG